MADTIRETIISSLCTILDVDSWGFGDVYRGRVSLDRVDLPFVTVLPGVESAEIEYNEMICTMPVTIVAVQAAGDTPSEISESTLGKLIECVIGGQSGILNIDKIVYSSGGSADYPEPGNQILLTGIDVEITYTNNLGDPYTQTSI